MKGCPPRVRYLLRHGKKVPAHRFRWRGSDALAAALGVTISDDAGAYVCNAWLYGVLGGTTLPAAFLHLPDQGMDPDALLRGIAVWISGFEGPD